MKKVFFAAAFIAGTALMTSCKKDYTCECTADDDFWNVSYTQNMKKKDAQDWCDTWDTNSGGVDGWSCELK